MIPSNIQRQHVLEAIYLIQQQGIPQSRESTKFDLTYNGQAFPPKLVLSYANRFANGKNLHQSEFSGGGETNSYLVSLGFEITEKSGASRNPPWQRDELILALDLYFRHNPSHINKNHPEIVRLSEVLNALPIHLDRPDEAKFRNPNGVYMKLCNFLRFDPAYSGTGLSSGGKLEEAVWQEFSSDLHRLTKIAQAIRQSVTPLTNTHTFSFPVDDEEEFPEGKVLYRMHRMRERDRTLVEKAKAKRLQDKGELSCDVCGFNFSTYYGDLGKGYIECHHTTPISEFRGRESTKLKDLAMVCANCHRMLHRRRPWLTIDQLTLLVGNRF